MNFGVIDSIARSLGEVLGTDFDEANSRVQFVRVRVNWNVNNPLRFQRNYQFIPGENKVISFFYERLRGFCAVCGMMTHDSGRCLLQNGGLDDSDDDANEDGDPEFHGNPGVHIQEIEDDQPNANNANDAADNPMENQEATDSEELDALSDIDPNHNALEDISSDSYRGMIRGEWVNAGDELFNPIPSFVNATGDLLERELRKRKQTEDGDNKFASQKRKTGPVIGRFRNMEVANGSGEGANTNIKDGAAVGPVPPPDP